MRKNSFDQFKNILHLLLLKPRIMPWLRASRLGLKAARSTGDYHIIHMLFFLWPPSFGGIPGDFLRIAGLTSIVRKALCRMSTRAA